MKLRTAGSALTGALVWWTMVQLPDDHPLIEALDTSLFALGAVARMLSRDSSA